jgi:hypothetical protein
MSLCIFLWIINTQFPSEEIAECALSMNEELLNTKYKDRLQPSYKVSWLSNLPIDMYVLSFFSSPSEVPCPVTVACYALLADTHLFLWPWVSLLYVSELRTLCAYRICHMMCSHKFYGGFRGPKSPDLENSVAVRMGIVCELHSKQRRAHCTLWRRVSFSCRSPQHLFFMRRY